MSLNNMDICFAAPLITSILILALCGIGCNGPQNGSCADCHMDEDKLLQTAEVLEETGDKDTASG